VLQKLWLNKRTLCFTELTFKQTDELDQNFKNLKDDLNNHPSCKYFWQNELRSNNQSEIYLDALKLYKGRGRLYELSESEMLSNNYIFDSFVRLSMSQRGHEVFETIAIPSGLYELQIHAMNDQPGPVIINVYAENIPIGTLLFDRDDGSWETKSLLLQPVHWNIQNDFTNTLTIRITFENAFPKRVANIAWLKIKPLSDKVIHE
jgi:hypothetical protein